MNPDHLDPGMFGGHEPEKPRRLSVELEDLLRQAAGRNMTIGELEDILQGRGVALFILIFCLPFAFPISLPGLSIPFGVVIMLMGIRVMLGRRPKLPASILNREISHAMLERIVRVGRKVAGWLERIAKPRMRYLQRGPWMINLIGAGIASGGVQLLLPLPPAIPFSNWLPAVSVICLIAGLIERDGLLTIFGYVLSIGGWIYFIAMAGVLGEIAVRVWHWYGAH